MDQPPPQLGQVSHPGLAKAVDEFTAGTTDATWLPVGAQLLYGYVLLNMTGSQLDRSSDGRMIMPGSTISIHAVLDDDDRPGLPIYSTQAAMTAGGPADGAPQESMVHPADGVFDLAEAMGFDYVLIDRATAKISIRLELGRQALGGPHDVGMRAALETGAAARRTILDGLVEHEGALYLAANRESLAETGPPGEPRSVQLRTATSPTGGMLISVYTSPAEVALRHMEDTPLEQSYDTVLAGTLAGPYEGLILNPGSSWIILTRTELAAASARRIKRQAKATKLEARAAAKAAKAAR